jgi:hypothetical protein
MKSILLALSPLLACGLLLLGTGCQTQPEWHMTASKQGDTVRICLSNGPSCPDPAGVSPAGIGVYEYDNTHDNRLVWDSQPDDPETGGKISGLVTYGVAPPHWTNKLTPPPLVCGKAYLVTPGSTLFGLKCDGTVVPLDYPQLDGYFRNLPPADIKDTVRH